MSKFWDLIDAFEEVTDHVGIIFDCYDEFREFMQGGGVIFLVPGPLTKTILAGFMVALATIYLALTAEFWRKFWPFGVFRAMRLNPSQPTAAEGGLLVWIEENALYEVECLLCCLLRRLHHRCL